MNRLKSRYDSMKAEACPIQACALCGAKGAKHSMDPHHPHGRHGENLLKFVWIHRHCHNSVHEFPKQAEALGLLGKR